ncbi:MAG: hypothetical protein ACKOX6_00830 [Bdellovibrio sp.]
MAHQIRMAQMRKALHIKRTIGLKAAIGYMRNRAWSPEAAVWVLLYSKGGMA